MLEWFRCFFTGHELAPVPIVPTDFEAKQLGSVNQIRLIKLKIESPLHYCRKCGRVTFGP